MDKIEDLILKYQEHFQHRDSRLFSEFLVKGYRETTLSCVQEEYIEEVIYAKFCLGMIITIYDDLADNPEFYSPDTLKDLYRLGLEDLYYPREMKPIQDLAIRLFRELRETLQSFPRYFDYKNVLTFDIKHIFLANQYSELITVMPSLRNLYEGKSLGPYNMGMVAAGMIDLMASQPVVNSELGKIREILIEGQRIGRIGNILSTFKRELEEGDLTNEMLSHPKGVLFARKELMKEVEDKIHLLKNLSLHTFQVDRYAQGLSCFLRLHKALEGVI